MDNPNQLAKRELPSLAELNHDIEAAFKNDKLNVLLNQPVPKPWIKEHPTATMEIEKDGQKIKVPLVYIPIEKIEFLLTRIFQLWRAEVINFSVMFQSVAVHVRLHYLNPVTGEWSYQDGLGAVGVQTDKGKSAADLAAIKQDAVMKALPAAESYAIKDAAEKLGILFGKNLNRKDTIGFSTAYDKEPTVPVITEDVKNFIDMQVDPAELDNLYDQNKQLHANPEFFKLISTKKQSLNKK